jgi:hypothetical protein
MAIDESKGRAGGRAAQRAPCDASEAERKLIHLQYLEGMRHVQSLEATEMAFVVAAFGFLIGGLLSRSEVKPLVFWVLVAAVSLMASLLAPHFRGRRSTHYWLRIQHQRLLNELGWVEHIKPAQRWFGFQMRVGMVSVLSTAVIVIAWALSGPGAWYELLVALALLGVALLPVPAESGCGLARWAVRRVRGMKIDPDTLITLEHGDGSLDVVTYGELRTRVRLGDEIRVAERPQRPGPETPITVEGVSAPVSGYKYRDLKTLLDYGLAVRVGEAEDGTGP